MNESRTYTWKDFKVGMRIKFRQYYKQPWTHGTIVAKSYGGPTYSSITVQWDETPGKEWMSVKLRTNKILTVIYHIEQGHLLPED